MKKKYRHLFTSVVFRSGIKIPTRFAMSPMVVEGSSKDGHVGEDDINYFSRRSETASMLITGATSVTANTNAFGFGLANCDDSYIEGLKKLANTMKKDGAIAVMQIFHPGREAAFSYKEGKKAYGPSSIEFSFLDYPVTELKSDEIEKIIKDFGEATLRAIKAGFDGVEIHGANHYLLQQFFSSTSNARKDRWGGTLEERSAFPLAVVDEVKRVIKENTDGSFVLGYRISPEEIHGSTIGYTFDDALFLIKEIDKKNIDYLHISQFGPEGFNNSPKIGIYKGKKIAKIIRETLDQKTKILIAGDITSADKALKASYISDMVALASAAIIEPDFVKKIKNGEEKELSMNITNQKTNLMLPQNFSLIKDALKSNGSVPNSTLSLLE